MKRSAKVEGWPTQLQRQVPLSLPEYGFAWVGRNEPGWEFPSEELFGAWLVGLDNFLDEDIEDDPIRYSRIIQTRATGEPHTAADVASHLMSLELDGSDEDEMRKTMAAFAAKFGFLTLPERLYAPWSADNFYDFIPAEHLWSWRAAAFDFCLASRVWRHCEELHHHGGQHARELVLQLIYISHGRHFLRVYDPYPTPVHIESPRTASDKELARAVRHAVLELLERKLVAGVSVQLGAYADGPEVTVAPVSLLHALYIDLAFSIADVGTRLSFCEYCHQPFPSRRRDAKTCSANCRSLLSYYRRRENLN